MNNFFKKQREVLAILVYVVFIFALVYFVVFPLLAKIGNVKDQIQEEAMNQEISRQQLSELPKIQDQYAVLEKNAASADVLLDKGNAVVLIENLEKLADDSGDKITITVDDQNTATTPVVSQVKNADSNTLVKNLPSANYLQFKIVLNGNFFAISKFVNSLESFNYYSDIIGIEIKKDDAINQSSLAVSDSGVLNPFQATGKVTAPGSSPSSSVQAVPAPANIPSDKLDATLDVVFYTK